MIKTQVTKIYYSKIVSKELCKNCETCKISNSDYVSTILHGRFSQYNVNLVVQYLLNCNRVHGMQFSHLKWYSNLWSVTVVFTMNWYNLNWFIVFKFYRHLKTLSNKIARSEITCPIHTTCVVYLQHVLTTYNMLR